MLDSRLNYTIENISKDYSLYFRLLYTYNLYLSDFASAHVAVVNTVRSLTITPLHEYLISLVNVSEKRILANNLKAHVLYNKRNIAN